MIGNFNEEAQNILVKAKLEMLDLNHPYIGTEHLVLSILHTNNELSKRLNEYGLTYDKFRKEIVTIIGMGSDRMRKFTLEITTLFLFRNNIDTHASIRASKARIHTSDHAEKISFQ